MEISYLGLSKESYLGDFYLAASYNEFEFVAPQTKRKFIDYQEMTDKLYE